MTKLKKRASWYQQLKGTVHFLHIACKGRFVKALRSMQKRLAAWGLVSRTLLFTMCASARDAFVLDAPLLAPGG